jgi:heptosyltransferase III
MKTTQFATQLTTQLVPQELLQKADKILFVAHLALGDFTYLQNCFRAFSQAYPHIKIHVWVDELRRTADSTQWEHLKKYSLYDWLESCSMFEKIYRQTYSPALLKASIQEARSENYPIVVSLAVLRRHHYARLVRTLSPNGFTAGQKKRVRFLDLRKHFLYRKLNAHIPAYQVTHHHQSGKQAIPHISSIYAGWFQQLFALTLSDSERLPYVDIPEHYLKNATKQLTEWGFANGEKIVFLNGFSKSPERSWSLERIFSLVAHMRNKTAWRNANFIINVVPEAMEQARNFYAKTGVAHIQLFSAEEHFFQLPAILSLCQLIISVETAVMHLANAVHVPVIALMRQTNPEWVPINSAISHVITASHRLALVDEITVDQVLAALPVEG